MQTLFCSCYTCFALDSVKGSMCEGNEFVRSAITKSCRWQHSRLSSHGLESRNPRPSLSKVSWFVGSCFFALSLPWWREQKLELVTEKEGQRLLVSLLYENTNHAESGFHSMTTTNPNYFPQEPVCGLWWGVGFQHLNLTP